MISQLSYRFADTAVFYSCCCCVIVCCCCFFCKMWAQRNTRAETLNSVTKPHEVSRQPLKWVRIVACYIVQHLLKLFLRPQCARAGFRPLVSWTPCGHLVGMYWHIVGIWAASCEHLAGTLSEPCRNFLSEPSRHLVDTLVGTLLWTSCGHICVGSFSSTIFAPCCRRLVVVLWAHLVGNLLSIPWAPCAV